MIFRKQNTILTQIFICISLVLLNSCKTSKEANQQQTVSIPSQFASKSDSTNSAIIHWKTFFNDSNLIALIDTGLKNNIDLQMALQRIEVARANVRSKKGQLFPTINAAGSAGQSKYGLYTMDGAGNITTDITPGQIVPIDLPDYYLGLQTAWEVDVWGKLRNQKKAAFAGYLASKEGRNWAVTTLVSEIATVYYELLALRNDLKIVRETILLQENAYKTVVAQKNAGAANELVVEQFEAQYLNSKNVAIEIEQEIIENENRLNFLLGRYPTSFNWSEEAVLDSLPKEIKLGIPSDMLKYRPDIRQAEFELIATKADAKAAKAAFYPSLTISGALGFQAFQTSFLFTTPESMAYRLFGNVVAPLVNRSAIKAHFNTAKALQVEAMFNYQKTILNGFVEVYNEMKRLQNLEQMNQLKNGEVNALMRSITTSSVLFQTGNANYLEVLFAQKNALNARLELIKIKKRQHQSVVNLYKALGGGWN
jgi:outer membrane protein, multidrug efflux system